MLHGVRVLDMSRLLPGPFCTQLLVDLGADVIKLEDPAGGDLVRHTPPLHSDGTSLLFHALNRGKRSVTIDLKGAAGVNEFLGLCADADVVVESFRPGVLARLGLSADDLRRRFPRLIVCSSSGYGQTDSLHQRAGHDVNYLARSGALSLMKTPTLLPVQVADLAGGAWPAAMQICAALFARERDNEGCVIDVSMTDGVSGLMAMTMARVVADEAVDGGEELLVGKVACYGVYPTADGFLAVGALEPKFWQAVCGVIDRAELVDRGWDDGNNGDNGAKVVEILTSIFARETTATWAARRRLLREQQSDARPADDHVAAARPARVRTGAEAQVEKRTMPAERLACSVKPRVRRADDDSTHGRRALATTTRASQKPRPFPAAQPCRATPPA